MYDENLLKQMIILRNTYDIKKAEAEEKRQKETVPKAKAGDPHHVRKGKKHVRKPMRKH
jgi:hypothetical protein